MIILILLVRALFSLIFPIGRVATQISGPIFSTGVRFVIAGLILLAYEKYKQRKLLTTININTVFQLGVVTVFSIYLTNVPEFLALLTVPSAKAAFIYSMSPFYAALLAYVLLGERLTQKKFLGMIVGLAGFILMAFSEAPSEIGTGGFGIFSAGEIALIVASISTVLGWMAVRNLVRMGESPLGINAVSMLIAGLAALATSPFFETWDPVPVTNYTTFGITMALAVVFPALIAYPLCSYLLKQYTTTLMSFAGFADVIFASFYGWIFLGEIVTWYLYAASAVVFVGLYLFYSEEFHQGYVPKT